jgi:AraC-like DNA-binding protein
MMNGNAVQDELILGPKADSLAIAGDVSDLVVGEERQWEETLETGAEQDYEIRLNRFLTLIIYRFKIQRDTHSDCIHSLPASCLEKTIALNFCISGRFRTYLQDLADEHWENPGSNYTEYVGGIREIELWPVGDPILRLRLRLDPQALIEMGFESALPPPLLHFIESGDLDPFYFLERTSPSMQWVLDQILSCRFTGAAKRLYWESKALELLALKVDQWASLYDGSRFSSPSPARIKPDDVERIHEAREILLQKIQDPPSLVELARCVGINDRKLKEGFREVFGTTVFGCLHDYRMTQARQLLLEDRLSVQQVAHAVGYRSLSSFSGAFKNQFGSPPKTFRKRWREG